VESCPGLLDKRLSHFRELLHGPGPAQPLLTHASAGPSMPLGLGSGLLDTGMGQ
jgi:hypothetical protein